MFHEQAFLHVRLVQRLVRPLQLVVECRAEQRSQPSLPRPRPWQLRDKCRSWADASSLEAIQARSIRSMRPQAAPIGPTRPGESRERRSAEPVPENLRAGREAIDTSAGTGDSDGISADAGNPAHTAAERGCTDPACTRAGADQEEEGIFLEALRKERRRPEATAESSGASAVKQKRRSRIGHRNPASREHD